MGGQSHGEPYKVPDASIYKVESAHKLAEVKEALARQGLKDPWLRNEVWLRLRTFKLCGFVVGFGLIAVTNINSYDIAGIIGLPVLPT